MSLCMHSLSTICPYTILIITFFNILPLSLFNFHVLTTHLLHSNPNSLMQHTEQFMATSGCNQFHLSNKKSLRDIDIPPRKLHGAVYHHQHESPTVLPEETLFKKFLPYNSGVDTDEDDDPYASDHFRMYEFKVRKCTRSRSHDWTDCPFAHPGEKARRRCPRRYNYLGTVCADFRRGICSCGDLCEFAHGVFECWLHPSRYRTEACKDGKNCQRKICFFAHTQRQLRVVPPEPIAPVKKYMKDGFQCCAHCRCHLDVHHTISPTSTLNIDMDSLSPPLSPPFSPARSVAGFSPISRFADRVSKGDHSFCMSHLGNNSSINTDSVNHELIGNRSINELVRSMEAMGVEEKEFQNMNSVWMNACFNGRGGVGVGGNQHQQFDLIRSNASSVNGPDLGWVNDLLR